MSVAAFLLGLVAVVFVIFPSLRLVALAPALLGGVLGVISRGHRHNSIVAAESFAALGTAFCGAVAFFVFFTSAQASS